jgi:hypothetical protein
VRKEANRCPLESANAFVDRGGRIRTGDFWLSNSARGIAGSRLSLRDKWAAHTDRESGRDVERVDEESDAPTLYVPSWPAGINRKLLPTIVRLCESQRRRFRDECWRLEEQLHDQA